MNRYWLITIFCFISLVLNAQPEVDHIDRHSFSILKILPDSSFIEVKNPELRNKKIVEERFGSDYTADRYYAETKNEYDTLLTFKDGFKLWIPEDGISDATFQISGNNYVLLLSSGKKIHVGMSAGELKTIFPKTKFKKDSFSVFFSTVRNGKVQIWDSWICFILSGEDGVLKEFYTYEPS